MENGTNINSINYIKFRTTLFMKIPSPIKGNEFEENMFEKKDERKKKLYLENRLRNISFSPRKKKYTKLLSKLYIAYLKI